MPSSARVAPALALRPFANRQSEQCLLAAYQPIDLIPILAPDQNSSDGQRRFVPVRRGLEGVDNHN